MSKILTPLFAITALTLSVSSHAAFVATDWKTSGDGLATLDTSTGIEWMDLSQTRGRSIQYVMDNLSTEFAGWRLPTQAEVQQMMRNFFSGVYTFNSTTGRVRVNSSSKTRIIQFETIFSRIYHKSSDDRGNYFSRGLYLGDDGNVKSAGAYRQTHWSVENHDLDYIFNVSSSLTYSGNQCTAWNTPCYSVWLVNDGGVTLSSIADPTININNPNAPINNPITPPGESASDVSAPLLGFIGFLGFSLLTYRRKFLVKGG